MRFKGDFKITIEKRDWKYVALFIVLIISLIANKTALYYLALHLFKSMSAIPNP